MRASQYYFPSLTGCQTAFTKKAKKKEQLLNFTKANISFMRISGMVNKGRHYITD